MKYQLDSLKIQLEALAKTGNIAQNLWNKTGLKKKVLGLASELKRRMKNEDYKFGEESYRYVNYWRSELKGKYDMWKYADDPELKIILKRLGTKFITGLQGTFSTVRSDIGYQPEDQIIQWLFGAGILFKAVSGAFHKDKEVQKRLIRDLEHTPDVIEHEVAHLMRDARFAELSRFIKRASAETPAGKKLAVAYTTKHTDFPFEIDATVSAIASLKKRFGDAKWNRISFNAIELALGKKKGSHFTPSQRKMMLKRMAREGLLGKNMRRNP